MNVLTTEEIEKRISDSYELPNNVLDAVPEPLVTIRTSTYNHGPYIRQCIEGVLMQKTNFPFELIIGEDYSTDETRDIVFEYAKKYPDIIRVITADYNVGSKANGRRCIRACRGKYMALCEGDDYWIDPLKLQKQVDFLEEHEDYGLIYTNYKVLYQDNNTIVNASQPNRPSGNVFDNLLRHNFIVTATVMLNFDFYKKINSNLQNYSQNWRMGDYPLWLEFALRTKVKYLPESTTVYRVLSESASHSTIAIDKIISFNKSCMDVQYFFATKNNKVDLLPFIIEDYNCRMYQFCLEHDSDKITIYRNYILKNKMTSRKMILFKLCARWTILEKMLRFSLNNMICKKIYSFISILSI